MPLNRQIEQTGLPIVALVGRVNVGKSTLFNRLIEERAALVSPIPGTTRTPNTGVVLWRGKEFRLVDTGGLTFTDDVPLEADILKQSERAMKEADVVVFVTNAQEGILPQEKELAKRLRRIQVKPVLFVANKADTQKLERDLTMPEWPRLGLGFPIPISAGNGRNIGDFLDTIHTTLEEIGKLPVPASDAAEPIRVSIIGKPNVGKSSLFNSIIGEERVIVSDLPHTTREPHDTAVIYEHKEKEDEAAARYRFIFVDTAGIRRKTKVGGTLERAGITKSLEAVDASDIVLFVLDGMEPISSQDKQLGGLLERHNKSVIILLNKWDLTEDASDAARNQAHEFIAGHFPHLSFAPILFVSGKTGYRVHQIFPALVRVWHARQTHIANRALEKFLDAATKEHRPSRGKGTRHPELMGMRQVHENPPIFELFVKARTSVHRSYLHFLERKLREQFDFFGTPIVIRLTKMKR